MLFNQSGKRNHPKVLFFKSTIYSLTHTKRQYICESCTETPSRFSIEYDDVTLSNSDTVNLQVLRDIESSISSISSTVEKIDLSIFVKNNDEKVKGIENSVCRLEQKFKDFEVSIFDKLEVPKTKPIDTDVPALQIKIDFLEKQIKAQENEIHLLQSDLSDKNKEIEKAEKRYKSISEELGNKTNSINSLTTKNALEHQHVSNVLSDVERLQSHVNSLNLQITTLQGQNNILAISEKDKDTMIYDLQTNISKMSEEIGRLNGEKTQLENSLKVLQSLLQTSKGLPQPDKKDKPLSEPPDVVIIHDSLFKDITEGILKNEGLTVRKIWAPRIKDAYSAIESMQIKPKAILVHTSTNDLKFLGEDEIVKGIIDTYHLTKNWGVKFIWSDITPRTDNIELNAKAQLVNALVGWKLAKCDGIIFCRNDNFYECGVINASLFEDEVHLNSDKGAGILAQNARFAICRALNKEFVPNPNKLKIRNNPYKRKKRL